MLNKTKTLTTIARLKEAQEKAWKGNNEKRKQPYCVPTTIKPLTKTLKKESEKKYLKEKGALRRAERKRTTKKNSMD